MPIFGQIIKKEEQDKTVSSSSTSYDKTEYRNNETYWDSALIPVGSYIGTLNSAEFKVIDTKAGNKWPTFAIKFAELRPYCHPGNLNKEEDDKQLFASFQNVLARAKGNSQCKITTSDQLRITVNLSLFDAQKQEILTIEGEQGETRMNPAWAILKYITEAGYGEQKIPLDRWDINFTPDSLTVLIEEELVGKKIQFEVGQKVSKSGEKTYNTASYFHAVSPEMEEYIKQFDSVVKDSIIDDEENTDVPF